MAHLGIDEFLIRGLRRVSVSNAPFDEKDLAMYEEGLDRIYRHYKKQKPNKNVTVTAKMLRSGKTSK